MDQEGREEPEDLGEWAEMEDLEVELELVLALEDQVEPAGLEERPARDVQHPYQEVGGQGLLWAPADPGQFPAAVPVRSRAGRAPARELALRRASRPSNVRRRVCRSAARPWAASSTVTGSRRRLASCSTSCVSTCSARAESSARRAR